jgi:hypothetical protein
MENATVRDKCEKKNKNDGAHVKCEEVYNEV